MGSIDAPQFVKDRMKSKIQPEKEQPSQDGADVIDAPDFIKKKETSSEDLYSGQRPASYPLPKPQAQSTSKPLPQLNLGEEQDFSPHTIYNNASQFILNDLENHPELLKNAPHPEEFKKQLIQGHGDLNIRNYSAQRVGEIEKQQKDLMDKIGEEMDNSYLGLFTDNKKIDEYKQQMLDLENKKSDFKNNVSEINDIQAVTMTPPPVDPRDQTEYLREVGRKVNKLNNPLGIEEQEKHIQDGTNVTKDKELLDLENFSNEQAGIEAKRKQLNVALGNGEINPEQYRVQHAGLTLAENKLLLNNPGAKTVINRNALSKIIDEKRGKDNPLDAYSGSLFHDIIRYTPSDIEVKDAIKTAREQGYPIGAAEEKRLIADKAMIPGTSALGNLYASSIGSLGVAVNKHNPFLNESQIESAQYQHESRLAPTQRQTKGVLGYVNQTANVVGTVLKWATLGKFLGAGANAIAGETVGAETIGGVDESLGGIKQLSQAQQHLAGTALTSGLLVYPEAKEEAKKFTKDESKQEAYAGTITLLNTLAFTSLNPEGILKDIVGDLGKSDFSKEFLKVVNKEGGIEKLAPETFKETVFNGLKKVAGANVSATATMSLLNLATQATDVMFGKKPNVDYNEVGKEAVNSFISFAPLSLLQGAGGAFADKNKRDITIQLVNQAAKDPIAFKNYMDKAADEGKVSREDANKKIQVVNSHAALSKSVDLPDHISEENKAAYVDNLRREIEIKQSMKAVDDEVQTKAKEEEIKALQIDRKHILEAPLDEENLIKEYRTKTGVTKEAVSDEDLLKNVAEQAQNISGGKVNETGNVEDSRRFTEAQAGKELVKAAVEKYPPEKLLVKPEEGSPEYKKNIRDDYFAKADFFTPEEKTKFETLDESGQDKMIDDKRAELAGKSEGNKLPTEEELKAGEIPVSRIDAERRFDAGERLFAFHDMEEGNPTEIKNVSELDNYTADQLIALPPTSNEGVGKVGGNAEKVDAVKNADGTVTIKSGNIISILPSVERAEKYAKKGNYILNYVDNIYVPNEKKSVDSGNTKMAESLTDVLNNHEEDENNSDMDLVQSVEKFIEDNPNDKLQKSISDYWQADKEAREKYGDRMDLRGDAFDKFEKVLEEEIKKENINNNKTNEPEPEIEKQKSEPPPPTEPHKEEKPEGTPDDKNVTPINKERQKEIEAVRQAYEKQGIKGWSETMKVGLEKIQKANPGKSLYDAAVNTLSEIRSGNYGDLTRDEAAATMHYLKHEVGKKRSELEKDTKSNDVNVRMESILRDNPLKDIYENSALAIKDIGTEAGRTLAYMQSELFDSEHGLQIRRMDLIRASGGEKLSPEDEKFVANQWEKEKEIQLKIQEAREASMQENFNKEIEKLHKEYAEKLKAKGAKATDNTTREKTLKQKGDEWADRILRAKIKTDPNILQSNILGLLPAAYNALLDGIAATVKGGATIAEAIKEVLKDDRFKGIKEDDLTNHLVEIANKKTTGETLQNIKDYIKDTGDTDVTKEMVGKNLIKDFVDSHIGEHDQKDILDKAAKDLKKVLPDIDKKKLIEAYLKEGDYKQETKSKLESYIKDQQAELKKIAKSELTADQEQKILLAKQKDLAIKKVKEFQKRIDNEDYSEPEPAKTLNKQDAELIRLQKEQSKVEGTFRAKQDELRQKNKSGVDLVAELGRAVYVAYLLHRFLTLGKVALAAIVRPTVEGATRLTLGKVFDQFFPGIGKSALLGGESSSWQANKLGFEAWYRQRGEKAIERMSVKSEAAFQKADREYQDYKKNIYDNLKRVNASQKEIDFSAKRLEKLNKERNLRMLSTFGNLAYQFIGGSSIKDALQAFIHRSNEIERQFGKVKYEGIEGENALKQSDSFPTIGKKLGKQVVEGGIDLFTNYRKEDPLTKQVAIKLINDADYMLGFIGRSHSALKTFSGRYSFASGFMARLEGAVGKNIELTPDKVLEYAHESYLDWERGKYQNPNQLSDWWSHTINKLDQSSKYGVVGKAGKLFFQTEVAIQRVPINILWEEISQYAGGLLKIAGLVPHIVSKEDYQSGNYNKASIPKLYREIKSDIKSQGIFTNTPEFKEALKKQLDNIDPYQAALIKSCFRKGSLGMGIYATTLILGGIHYGIFPHMGQKKKKDEDKLAPHELNPGQLMVGDTKYSEETSALISHTQFLWPTFMGLGMAQAYDDNVKSGKTTAEAMTKAAYLHLNIIAGNVPQFAPFETLKERTIDPFVNKAIKNTLGADHQGFTKEDAKDPTFKYYFDKGVEFTPFNPSKVEIPKKGKLSELPQEKWEEYNTEKKRVLKQELSGLKNETFYVTPDDKVHREEPDEGKFSRKKLGQLTVQQLKKVIVPAETAATEAAKEKLAKEK